MRPDLSTKHRPQHQPAVIKIVSKSSFCLNVEIPVLVQHPIRLFGFSDAYFYLHPGRMCAKLPVKEKVNGQEERKATKGKS